MTVTYYLCIGHPGWPDPLRLTNRDHALRWFLEWRDQYPVRVDEVTEQRNTIRDAS